MNNEKVCSFFVSENHLLTTLLPYINEKMSEEKEIILILQNDMIGYVKKYLKKVKSLNMDNESILQLCWRKTKIDNIQINKTHNLKEIVIVGNKEYIEKVNGIISFDLNTDEIVNCYKLENMEPIEKILSSHNAILSTKGKNIIPNNSQNEQKRETIKSQI